MTARRIVPALVVLALALGVTGIVLVVRGDDGGGNEPSAATSTSTSAPTTTQAPTTTTGSFTTTPTQPPPAPTTTVTPGTVVVLPTAPPATTAPAPTTAPPPDTAASDPTPTSTAPTTTEPDDDVAEDTLETVVYSPEGAPERKGNLLVPAEHNSTAIVLVHGGGGDKGHRRQMRGWAQGYAEAGYLTLAIDYFKFDDTTEPPVFPVPERDVKAAVQYLRLHADELGIEPDRILVQGFGSGAGLGSIAYVTGDDPAFAGVGLYDDGTSDVVNGFIGFYGTYEGERADPEQYCGGAAGSTDPAVQACYELSDAVARAADATGPALLVHGDADETVPSASTELFGDALTTAEQNALVLIVEGADHNFDRVRRTLTPEGEAVLAEILAWLEATFPEPPPPTTTTTEP